MLSSLKLALLALSYVFATICVGSSADSLRAAISKCTDDKEKMELWVAFSDVCPLNEIEPACVRALAISDRLLAKAPNDTSILSAKAFAFNNIGFANHLTDYAKALEYFELALELNLRVHDTTATAESYNNIGFIYMNKGDIEHALDYYNKSVALRREIGEFEQLASNLNNIGFIFAEQYDYKQALPLYQEALQLSRSTKNDRIEGYTLNNIGYIYLQTQVYDTALVLFEQALVKYQTSESFSGEATCNINLGKTHEYLGNFSKALEHHRAAIDIQTKIGDTQGKCVSHISLAKLYMTLNNNEQAYAEAKAGYDLAIQLDGPLLLEDASLTLFKVEKKRKHLDQAIQYYEVYVSNLDRSYNDKNKRAMIQQQLKFEFDQKTALRKQKEADTIAVLKVNEEKQRIIKFALIAGLILAIVIILWFYQTSRYRDKSNRELRVKNAEIAAINKTVNHSINYAKQIQEAMLPSSATFKEAFDDHFILFRPKSSVSGDFYWCHRFNTDHVVWATIDCTGHGVPGALLSMTANSLLNRIIIEHKELDPSKILQELRKSLKSTFEHENKSAAVGEGLDIALCVLDKSTNTVKFAGANSSLIVVRSEAIDAPEHQVTKVADSTLVEIAGDPLPVGTLIYDELPYTTQEFKLKKNDSLYTFSDGYQDQFGGPKTKKIGYTKLKELLATQYGGDFEAQHRGLDRFLDDWMDTTEQLDDVCVIGVKI